MTHSTKWQYSGNNNPCPICDRTKDGDCRISEDGSMVLCHSSINGDIEREGWKYVKPNADDRCGVYVISQEKSPRQPNTTHYHKYIDRKYGGEHTFRRHYDQQGKKDPNKTKWTKTLGVPESELLPYRWVEVKEAIAQDRPVYLVEGELVADELVKLGIVATNLRTKPDSETVKLFQGAHLIICPDRDREGIKKAQAKYDAFKSVAASIQMCLSEPNRWVYVPDKGGRDLHDWIIDGASREDIEGAIEPLDLKQFATVAAVKTDPVGDGEKFEGGKPHFWSTPEKGLVWESFERNPETGEMNRTTTSVGLHLKAIAYIDNPDRDGAALLLEFKTLQGQIRRWTMPRTGLVSNPSALVDDLFRMSYSFKRRQKLLLLDYLFELGADVEETYTVTDRTGWVNGSFVLPHKTYGDRALRFRDVEPQPNCPIEIKGTLDSWRSEVAASCQGNSRLIFALGTAFAAPLLPIIGIESGGFHMMGATSQGKTSALAVAASVLGVRDMPLWRTTANGLESAATEYNHLCMPIDEIGQAEAKEVGQSAYMLANGQGKSRMKRDLTRSKPKTWQLLFLSSGELSLRDYLKQAGISIKGGQEVRLPDLPAIPQNSQYGVFESIGQYESSAAFVNALEQAVRDHRGSALDAFLERLVSDNQGDGFAKAIADRTFAIAKQLAAHYTDTAISRVAKRFALVQVGLELAHSYGLLPFPIEQCGWAVKTMFDDWVNARGGDGSIEIKQALERIEYLFVSNEYSDRVYNLDSKDEQTVRNLLCYRKKDELDSGTEYWVPPAIFDRELATGVDRAALIAELQSRGWLKEPDAEGKNSLRRYLNGKRQRVYVFTQFWRGAESGDINKSGVPGVPGVPDPHNVELEGVSGGTPTGHSTGHRKNEVSRDCTEFDTTRDTVKNEVSRGNIPGVPQQILAEQASQPDGTHGTPGTPQKDKSPKTAPQNVDRCESDRLDADGEELIIVDSLDPTEIGKVYRDD
jgi:putative DNA primase/helicase